MCPTEIRAFSDRIAEFEKLNVSVVAASVDSEFSHLAWTKQPRTGPSKRTIAIEKERRERLGRGPHSVVSLFFSGPNLEGGLGPMNIPILSDITKNISRSYGVLLEKEGVALRGLFLIDPEGVLRQATINDLPVGRSVDETLRLIQAFQFHAKHGEVCPAGWTPGQESMKTDSQKTTHTHTHTHTHTQQRSSSTPSKRKRASSQQRRFVDEERLRIATPNERSRDGDPHFSLLSAFV